MSAKPRNVAADAFARRIHRAMLAADALPGDGPRRSVTFWPEYNQLDLSWADLVDTADDDRAAFIERLGRVKFKPEPSDEANMETVWRWVWADARGDGDGAPRWGPLEAWERALLHERAFLEYAAERCECHTRDLWPIVASRMKQLGHGEATRQRWQARHERVLTIIARRAALDLLDETRGRRTRAA